MMSTCDCNVEKKGYEGKYKKIAVIKKQADVVNVDVKKYKDFSISYGPNGKNMTNYDTLVLI